jgi:hypothetical protein
MLELIGNHGFVRVYSNYFWGLIGSIQIVFMDLCGYVWIVYTFQSYNILLIVKVLIRYFPRFMWVCLDCLHLAKLQHTINCQGTYTISSQLFHI